MSVFTRGFAPAMLLACAAGSINPAPALADTPPPTGANNWSCRPSLLHPRPVILVHGTFENMWQNWSSVSPALATLGYCVYALNYGGNQYGNGVFYGMGPIEQSAAQLSSFVDQVLAATGAAKVDIVGHSQGGMMPRYYLKFLGGASKVRALIGLVPSNHGTTLDGFATLSSQNPAIQQAIASGCPACAEQIVGSDFLNNLNAGGDTVSGVSYTVVETRYDEVVTPYTSAFLQGAGVTNILLQDQNPLDTSDHNFVSYDATALADILAALGP